MKENGEYGADKNSIRESSGKRCLPFTFMIYDTMETFVWQNRANDAYIWCNIFNSNCCLTLFCSLNEIYETTSAQKYQLFNLCCCRLGFTHYLSKASGYSETLIFRGYPWIDPWNHESIHELCKKKYNTGCSPKKGL